MPALRFIPPSLVLLPAATVLAGRLLADRFARIRRARVIREEDLSDWLRRDVGLLDGRDTAARRAGSTRDRGFIR